MTHPYGFQWTWKKWHPILSCSPIWYITLLQPKRYSSVKICFALQKQTLTQRYHSHKKISRQAAAHLSLWLGLERTRNFPASSPFFLYGSRLKKARCPSKRSLWIRDTAPAVFGLACTDWLGILVHSVTMTGLFFFLNNKNRRQLTGRSGEITVRRNNIC